MSDAVMISLINGFMATVSTIFTGWIAYKITGLNSKADAAKELGESTHALVNGAMLAQLRISALALRRIAALTKNPEDIEASVEAAKLLTEHIELKQWGVSP